LLLDAQGVGEAYGGAAGPFGFWLIRRRRPSRQRHEFECCANAAIGIGKATIKYPNEGAQLPNAAMFGGMSHASLLATTSLGHIFGIGAILGLAARGVV
jgi:photosystem I subunit 10